MKRTLRVKNCLYFDVELFLELMLKLSVVISSYEVQGTKETGNIDSQIGKVCLQIQLIW